MHILKTINLKNNKFYYSPYFGIKKNAKSQLDPLNKFEIEEAEDGSKSVITIPFKKYGVKESMNNAMSLLHAANIKNPTFISTIDVESIQVDEAIVAEAIADKKIELVDDTIDVIPPADTSIPADDIPPTVDNPTPDEDSVPVVDEKPLDEMKRSELNDVAKKLGLDEDDYRTKADIIVAIEAEKSK